jgi:hypothetical protein
MYQGEEVFTGRPHATEDAVKGYIANLIMDPEQAIDDEMELGNRAANYFQLQGTESPTHPLWDWVDDVMDDMMKRRHSSTKTIVGRYRKSADDETALVPYRRNLPEEDEESYEGEVIGDDWSIDEHYWGLEADEGEITKVRLGNWSDAGWHWSDDGSGLLLFLFRIMRSEVAGEFLDKVQRPEIKKAIERTFQRNVEEEEGFNSLAYSFTGDNAGWHFGENDNYVSERFGEDLEYQLEAGNDTWLYTELQNALADLGIDIRQVDDKDLMSAVDDHINWSAVSADEDKIVGEFEENLSSYFDFESFESFMESVEEQSQDVNYDLYEALDEAVYNPSEDPFGEDFIENVVETISEEYEPHVSEDERQQLYTPDPRQQKLPFNAMMRKAAAAWRVKAARIPKEMLRGLEFAKPVEFIYPDTGEKGIGRIMDFTRTDEGIVVSVAPHLYQEEEEWFRQDPHDFVDVPIDNVFPTEQFKTTFDEAPWRPREGSYGTESSSPMFRTTGQDELSTELSDEMLNDQNMRELVEVALDMSSRQSSGRWNVTWDELAAYLHDIYIEYGTAPELADPADWNWVAKEVYQDLVGKGAEQMVGSTRRRRTARRGEDLGRPRMHREEGGYKSKKKLFEFLDAEGAPVKGKGDETYGKKSMIYISWPDPKARKEWERRLEDAGFKVHKDYWPGSSTSEIQVSYFKGWHWDE